MIRKTIAILMSILCLFSPVMADDTIDNNNTTFDNSNEIIKNNQTTDETGGGAVLNIQGTMKL